MKKFTFVALVALLAGTFTAKAQIQEGNVMVGGNLSNINFGLNSPNPFSFQITPKAAWFIVDNVALGGYANLGIQTAKNSPTTLAYGVGGLGRYYTGNDVAVLKHGRFFAEANLGIEGQNISGPGGANTNGLGLGVGPGFAYFITPSIGLETLLKYNGNVGFGSQTYAHNLNLSFGFQIYLPGKSTVNKVKGDVRR